MSEKTSSNVAKRPTIRDVATLAGVSKSLVSLVFSSPDQVSDERRRKVISAADKLGYTPNFMARSLAAESGIFIGILVEDLHNPFISELVDDCRAYLDAHDEGTFVTSAMLTESNGELVIDRLAVNALIDLRPKAILVVGQVPDIESLRRIGNSIPIVCASDIPRGIDNAVSVRGDDMKGVKLVVDHLVSLGHTKISHIMGPTRGTMATERKIAYETAMLAHGLQNEINCVGGREAIEKAGYEAAVALLKSDKKPTAIVCYNDVQAIGAQQAIIEHEKATGEKIALTGYDNTYLSALTQISLTTVEPQKKLMAEKAVTILLQRLENKAKGLTEVLTEPQLVVRNSTSS